MPRPGRYERLIRCPECLIEGLIWDPILNDYVIECSKCVGEGEICGECYHDVITCDGEGVCWDEDPEDIFDVEGDY
jgi:hypothetical protein